MNTPNIKSKFFVLWLSGLLCMVTLSVAAQESGYEGGYPDFPVSDQPTYEQTNPSLSTSLTDSETTPKKENTAEKTHVEVKKKPVKPAAKETKKKENNAPTNVPSNYNGSPEAESVLEYNFLYYMIQKFKYTDVIDQ